MNLPQYITIEEVKRVCRELKIRDWTTITTPIVLDDEAAVILNEVNAKGMDISVQVFRQGLEVELEHGTRFDDANVTNNHPILTGMIVLAHLKETMDYYDRLDVVEMEGDMLKALLAGDLAKVESKYKSMLKAQTHLYQSLIEQLR